MNFTPEILKNRACKMKFERANYLFKKYLLASGYKEKTVDAYLIAVNNFTIFNLKYGKNSIQEITENDLVNFTEYLFSKKSRLNKIYNPATIKTKLEKIKMFFGFLYKNDYLLVNPLESFKADIKTIKPRKIIFSCKEIDNFLDCIDLKELHGFRNRTIFELMYSSGLRISEVVNLNVDDINLSERILLVQNGKGGKDRLVPFSKVAARFLNKYIQKERTRFLCYADFENIHALFLNYNGRLTHQTIRYAFALILKKCKLEKKGLTPHSIRHSTATHLLEAGANIRYIQELLGHADIGSTEVYTHLIMDKVKKAYKSYHPRENEYYLEVDSKYLQDLDELKEEIIARQKINKKYHG